MKRLTIGVFAAVCALGAVEAEQNAMSAGKVDPASMPSQNRLHLYALLGQPGDGMFQDDVSWRGEPHERRLMVYDADGMWRRTSGRGIEFGLWMENSGPLHYVGLVPCAVAGSQAADWKPGTANFVRAVQRVKAAMNDGVFTGILWHGGGDFGSVDDFAEMISAFRKEIGYGDVPVAFDGSVAFAVEAASRIPNALPLKASDKPIWKRFANTLKQSENDDIVGRPIPLRAYKDGSALRIQPARVSAYPLNQEWPGYQRPKEQTEMAYFVSLAVEKPCELTLEMPFDVPADVRIRPLGVPHKTTRDGNRLKIAVRRPEQFSVEFGEKRPVVYVFADPPFEYRHSPDEIYFGPGEHDVGVIAPTNGQTICIDEGAIVYGSIYAYGVRDVKITGRGVIDASRLHRDPDAPSYRYVRDVLKLGDNSAARALNCLTLYGCTNVTVEGVVRRDPARWTMLVRGHSRDVVVDNVKVIGLWRYCTDGIDITTSERVTVRNSFFRTYDDCIVLRATLEEKSPVRDILVENCVLWCDWGRNLEIIYDGGTANPLVENVLYRNVKIVNVSVSACSIDSRLSLATRFRNIRYENIEVDFVPPRYRQKYQYRYDTRFEPSVQNEGLVANIQAKPPRDRQGNAVPPESGKEVLFEKISFDGIKVYGDTAEIKALVQETAPNQNLDDVVFRNVPDNLKIVRKKYDRK